MERQKHTYTGVGASVKLQYKVLSGRASIARISGVGAADTFSDPVYFSKGKMPQRISRYSLAQGLED